MLILLNFTLQQFGKLSDDVTDAWGVPRSRCEWRKGLGSIQILGQWTGLLDGNIVHVDTGN